MLKSITLQDKNDTSGKHMLLFFRPWKFLHSLPINERDWEYVLLYPSILREWSMCVTKFQFGAASSYEGREVFYVESSFPDQSDKAFLASAWSFAEDMPRTEFYAFLSKYSFDRF